MFLRIDNTMPLREKADSEATVEAWTLSNSRVMAARTGKKDSLSFHQTKISKLENFSVSIVDKKIGSKIPPELTTWGVTPRPLATRVSQTII